MHLLDVFISPLTQNVEIAFPFPIKNYYTFLKKTNENKKLSEVHLKIARSIFTIITKVKDSKRSQTFWTF